MEKNFSKKLDRFILIEICEFHQNSHISDQIQEPRQAHGIGIGAHERVWFSRLAASVPALARLCLLESKGLSSTSKSRQNSFKKKVKAKLIRERRPNVPKYDFMDKFNQ